VWWRCLRGHDWVAPVSSRSTGTGCRTVPASPATTTLIAGYPALAEQWDAAANGTLTAAVTSGSDRRVGWRCAHGHTWAARIYSRTRGTGCPYCAGRLATPQTSLAALRPDLAAEWAHDLNGDLAPTTVRLGSNARVWWRCPTDPDHAWRATVDSRSSQATGCPFCTGARVTPQTSLAATHPEVAAGWDPDRNGGRTPDTVAAGSKARTWWRCPAGHRW